MVIGLDVGTTSAKATAFDLAGRARGHGEVSYPLEEPEPGHAVQRSDQVVSAALRATRAAVHQAQRAGRPVVALSCSAAMHGLLALGRGDRVLTPLLTWADLRGTAQAERLRSERPELHAATGTPLHPMSPLCKLVWFRECAPELHARALRWVGVKELVLHRLTGRWVVDRSIASGTGLLDLATSGWFAPALEVAGVRPEQLAELVPAEQRLELTARAASELGLGAGLPVVAGAGDGPLANVGVGAVRAGVAACSIGTSGALRLTVEQPAVDARRRTFAYALSRDRWVVGGAINNGGVVLKWAGDALAPDLGDHAEAALLRLAADAPPGCDGLIMAPYLLSERAPHWSALDAGAYVGLTRHHRRAHLVRAALEGVCQQLALVLGSLRDVGYEVREVRATGGFARSALWRQILADVLGMPIGFPSGHEGSGFGAALMGMEALGLAASLDVAAELVTVDDVVEPDPAAAAVYTQLRPIFAALHDELAPAFRALRDLRGA